MIIRKPPLVKLLELADQAYLDNPLPAGPGHPFIYSERVMFKCFVLKAIKKMEDCSALYAHLNHPANWQVRQAVGLAEQMPALKTFQRRFEASAALMRRQLRSVAQVLVARGVITTEMLAVDGSMCEALGPLWHQSDKLYAHLPEKLPNLDLSAEWGKSGYHGWVYGYKAYGTRWDEAQALVSWSNIVRVGGNSLKVESASAAALAISREVGDRVFIVLKLEDLAQIVLFRGDYTQATAYLNESRAIRQEWSHRRGAYQIEVWQGWIALLEEDFEVAKKHFKSSLAYAQEIGERRAEPCV